MFIPLSLTVHISHCEEILLFSSVINASLFLAFKLKTSKCIFTYFKCWVWNRHCAGYHSTCVHMHVCTCTESFHLFPHSVGPNRSQELGIREVWVHSLSFFSHQAIPSEDDMNVLYATVLSENMEACTQAEILIPLQYVTSTVHASVFIYLSLFIYLFILHLVPQRLFFILFLK